MVDVGDRVAGGGARGVAVGQPRHVTVTHIDAASGPRGLTRLVLGGGGPDAGHRGVRHARRRLGVFAHVGSEIAHLDLQRRCFGDRRIVRLDPHQRPRSQGDGHDDPTGTRERARWFGCTPWTPQSPQAVLITAIIHERIENCHSM